MTVGIGPNNRISGGAPTFSHLVKCASQALIAVAVATAIGGAAQAQTMLRVSHQYPGGKGDLRDEMVQLLKREVESANVGLAIQNYPGASLFKPKEQWGALTSGQLDISVFALDYASGRVPQFSATLMPGLVRNHDRAARLNDSAFMKEIKRLAEANGVIVLADAWLAGAFASKKDCITDPDSIQGQVMRGAGPAFEQMLAAAGASISSMPSSEIYTAMQTGVLDATNTSTISFVSFRLYEQVKCLTAPGENALWFMYVPIVMSEKSLDKLTPEQREVLIAAGEKAEQFYLQEAKKVDQEVSDVFRENGVEVIEMSQEDFDAWLAVAQEASYKNFSESVEGGDELIKMALEVK